MKRKFRFFIFALALILPFSLVGCKGDLVGTYVASAQSGAVVNTYKIVLKANNSCVLTKSLESYVLTEYSGTYSLDGSKITFHLKWKTDIENEGDYSGTILSDGSIKLSLFGQTLTYHKT